MVSKISSLEEIRQNLTQLRQDPKTRKKFPKQLWEDIFSLIHLHSLEEVCGHLNFTPSFLKRKMRERRKTAELEFQEIPSFMTPSVGLTIEICSESGLKAKIHGPLDCLHILQTLFKG